MNALKSVLLASAVFAAPAWPRLEAQGSGGHSFFTIDPATGFPVPGVPVALDPAVEEHRLNADFDGLVLSDIVQWLRAVPAYQELNFVESPRLADYGLNEPIRLKLRSVKLRDVLTAISIATDDRVLFEVRTPTMIAVVPGPNWQPPEPKFQVVNRDGDRVVEVVEAVPPPPSYQVVNLREVLRLNDPAAADGVIRLLQELVEQTLLTIHGNTKQAPKLNYHSGSGVLVVVGQPDVIKVTMDILRNLRSPEDPTSPAP